MSLRASLTEYQAAFQGELFPALEEVLGPLPERYARFVQVLEFVLVDAVVLPAWPGGRGRPPEDRRALARAFLAKAVFDVPTTRALIERLQIDGTLRRLCGWTRAGAVPSEATFSRAFAAFAAFAASRLPERLHAGLVAKTLRHRLVGHISRDATAIPARERATPKPPKPVKHRRGRPHKGEERRPRRRRKRQQTMPHLLPPPNGGGIRGVSGGGARVGADTNDSDTGRRALRLSETRSGKATPSPGTGRPRRFAPTRTPLLPALSGPELLGCPRGRSRPPTKLGDMKCKRAHRVPSLVDEDLS